MQAQEFGSGGVSTGNGMPFLANLAAGAGVASAAMNVGSGLYNIFGAKRRREIQFAREDTAVQRRAADLEAAGLSKTLAAGGAAQASTPIFPGDKNVDTSDLTNAMLAKENAGLIQQNINTSKSQERVNDMQKNKITAETLGVLEENTNKKIKNSLDQWRLDQTMKESDYFGQMGLPMLYNVPGITGEVSRLLSSFFKATKDIFQRKPAFNGLKAAGEWLDNFNGSIEEANSRIDSFLKGVPGMVGNAFEKTKSALLNAWQRRQSDWNQRQNERQPGGIYSGPYPPPVENPFNMNGR